MGSTYYQALWCSVTPLLAGVFGICLGIKYKISKTQVGILIFLTSMGAIASCILLITQAQFVKATHKFKEENEVLFYLQVGISVVGGFTCVVCILNTWVCTRLYSILIKQ